MMFTCLFKKVILASSAYNLGDKTHGNVKGTGSQRQQTDNRVCAWTTNKGEITVDVTPHNYRNLQTMT